MKIPDLHFSVIVLSQWCWIYYAMKIKSIFIGIFLGKEYELNTILTNQITMKRKKIKQLYHSSYRFKPEKATNGAAQILARQSFWENSTRQRKRKVSLFKLSFGRIPTWMIIMSWNQHLLYPRTYILNGESSKD